MPTACMVEIRKPYFYRLKTSSPPYKRCSSPYRGTNVSLKWITEFARARAGKSMSLKLSNEIMDAAKETGNSIRRKEQTHKMADANKAFAHFRW